MFEDAAEALRVIVALHGSISGCSERTLREALYEDVFPGLGLKANDHFIDSTLTLLRMDGAVETRRRHPTIGSSQDDGDDPDTIMCFPTRSLQLRVLGLDDVFMTRCAWRLVDELSTHVMFGVSRDDLRCAILADGFADSDFHIAVRRLQKIMSAVAVAIHEETIGRLVTRLFLTVVHPGYPQSVGRNVLVRRFVLRQRQRPVAPSPPLAQSLIPEAEDLESSDGMPSSSDTDENDSEYGQPQQPSLLNKTTAYFQALEYGVIVKILEGRASISLRRLTKKVLMVYRVRLQRRKDFLCSCNCIQQMCSDISSLEVYQSLCAGKRRGLRMMVRHAQSSKMGEGPGAALTSGSSFRCFPLLPLKTQILDSALRGPVAIEDTRPNICKMKRLVDRVRAAASLPPYTGRVEVTARKSRASKAFTVVVQPTSVDDDEEDVAMIAESTSTEVGEGGAPQNTTSSAKPGRHATNGVSLWARTTFMDALQQSPHRILVLEDIMGGLFDRKTINRLIPLLREQGRIVTSGIQLPNHRERLGLIMDARATVTEEEKREVATAYFRARSALKSKGTQSNAENRRDAAGVGEVRSPETSDADDETDDDDMALVARATKRRRVECMTTPRRRGTKIESTDGNSAEPPDSVRLDNTLHKARATMCLIGNGYGPNDIARAWRLHLELWDICVRLRSSGSMPTRKASLSTTQGGFALTLDDVVQHMSLSTFCVVVGFNMDDVRSYVYYLDEENIPWGDSIRLLPSALRTACRQHSWVPLMQCIRTLVSYSAIHTNIPTVTMEAPSQDLPLSCLIWLQPVIMTANGAAWDIHRRDGGETSPTDILIRVSQFWSEHVAANPLTTLPPLSSKNLLAITKVVETAAPSLLSLSEVFGLSRVFRSSLPPLITYCLRAGGRLEDFARCVENPRSDHVGSAAFRHPAVKRLLVHREQNVTAPGAADEHKDEEEQADRDAGAHDAGIKRRNQQGRRVKVTSTFGNDLLPALRLAVVDKQSDAVLARIQRLIRTQYPEYAEIIETLRQMLRCHWPSVRSVSSVATMDTTQGERAGKLALLDSVWNPEGVSSFDSAIHACVAGGAISLPQHRDGDDRDQMLRTLREHRALRNAMVCIAASHWNHVPPSSRDGLLAPYEAASIQRVARALCALFPRSFCEGSSNPRIGSRRLHRLLQLRSCGFPLRLDVPLWSNTMAARQAKAVCDDVLQDAGETMRMLDADSNEPQGSVMSELLQQPIVDVDLTRITSENSVFEGIYLPTLNMPTPWRVDVANSVAAASGDFSKRWEAEDAGLDPSMPLRDVDPIRQFFTLQYEADRVDGFQEFLDSVPIALPSCIAQAISESVETSFVTPQSWLATPLCHADGTINALMCSMVVSLVRSELLTRPGLAKTALVSRLADIGLLDEDMCAEIVDRLVTSRVIRSAQTLSVSPQAANPFASNKLNTTTTVHSLSLSLRWSGDGGCHPLSLLFMRHQNKPTDELSGGCGELCVV